MDFDKLVTDCAVLEFCGSFNVEFYQNPVNVYFYTDSLSK